MDGRVHKNPRLLARWPSSPDTSSPESTGSQNRLAAAGWVLAGGAGGGAAPEHARRADLRLRHRRGRALGERGLALVHEVAAFAADSSSSEELHGASLGRTRV